MKSPILALMFTLFALFPFTLKAQSPTPTAPRIYPNEQIAISCLSKSPLVDPATDWRFRERIAATVEDMEAHLALLKGVEADRIDSASWRTVREQFHNYHFLAPADWEITSLSPGFLFNTPNGLANLEEVVFGGGDMNGFLDIISAYDRCVQSTLTKENLDIDLYTFAIQPHGRGTQALIAFIVSYIPPGQSDFIIVGASYDSSLLSIMLEVMDSIQFEYLDWIQSV